jgi:hypothetical protein
MIYKLSLNIYLWVASSSYDPDFNMLVYTGGGKALSRVTLMVSKVTYILLIKFEKCPNLWRTQNAKAIQILCKQMTGREFGQCLYLIVSCTSDMVKNMGKCLSNILMNPSS